MNTQEIINEVTSLPTEERTVIVETLLRSLNPPESEIDQHWKTIAQQRISDLKSGDTNTVSGEEVFDKIWGRLNQ